MSDRKILNFDSNSDGVYEGSNQMKNSNARPKSGLSNKIESIKPKNENLENPKGGKEDLNALLARLKNPKESTKVSIDWDRKPREESTLFFKRAENDESAFDDSKNLSKLFGYKRENNPGDKKEFTLNDYPQLAETSQDAYLQESSRKLTPSNNNNPIKATQADHNPYWNQQQDRLSRDIQKEGSLFKAKEKADSFEIYNNSDKAFPNASQNNEIVFSSTIRDENVTSNDGRPSLPRHSNLRGDRQFKNQADLNDEILVDDIDEIEEIQIIEPEDHGNKPEERNRNPTNRTAGGNSHVRDRYHPGDSPTFKQDITQNNKQRYTYRDENKVMNSFKQDRLNEEAKKPKLSQPVKHDFGRKDLESLTKAKKTPFNENPVVKSSNNFPNASNDEIVNDDIGLVNEQSISKLSQPLVNNDFLNKEGDITKRTISSNTDIFNNLEKIQKQTSKNTFNDLKKEVKGSNAELSPIPARLQKEKSKEKQPKQSYAYAKDDPGLAKQDSIQKVKERISGTYQENQLKKQEYEKFFDNDDDEFEIDNKPDEKTSIKNNFFSNERVNAVSEQELNKFMPTAKISNAKEKEKELYRLKQIQLKKELEKMEANRRELQELEELEKERNRNKVSDKPIKQSPAKKGEFQDEDYIRRKNEIDQILNDEQAMHDEELRRFDLETRKYKEEIDRIKKMKEDYIQGNKASVAQGNDPPEEVTRNDEGQGNIRESRFEESPDAKTLNQDASRLNDRASQVTRPSKPNNPKAKNKSDDYDFLQSEGLGLLASENKPHQSIESPTNNPLENKASRKTLQNPNSLRQSRQNKYAEALESRQSNTNHSNTQANQPKEIAKKETSVKIQSARVPDTTHKEPASMTKPKIIAEPQKQDSPSKEQVEVNSFENELQSRLGARSKPKASADERALSSSSQDGEFNQVPELPSQGVRASNAKPETAQTNQKKDDVIELNDLGISIDFFDETEDRKQIEARKSNADEKANKETSRDIAQTTKSDNKEIKEDPTRLDRDKDKYLEVDNKQESPAIEQEQEIIVNPIELSSNVRQEQPALKAQASRINPSEKFDYARVQDKLKAPLNSKLEPKPILSEAEVYYHQVVKGFNKAFQEKTYRFKRRRSALFSTLYFNEYIMKEFNILDKYDKIERDYNALMGQQYNASLTQQADFYDFLKPYILEREPYITKLRQEGDSGLLVNCYDSKIGSMQEFKDFTALYKIEKLGSLAEVAYIRQVKSDGDSFYRAFVYSLMEQHVMNKGLMELKMLVLDVFKIMQDKKAEIEEKGAVINNFYAIYYEILQSLEKGHVEKALSLLLYGFNSEDESFEIIMVDYIRSILYLVVEEFQSQVNQAVQIQGQSDQARPEDVNLLLLLNNKSEACKYALQVAPQVYGVNLDLYIIDGNINSGTPKVKVSKESFPCNGKKANSISLFYNLSHYDVIYTKGFMTQYDSILGKTPKIASPYGDVSITAKASCEKCKKQTTQVQIPFYESRFCLDCAKEYITLLSKNRLIFQNKENYHCREYYCNGFDICDGVHLNDQLCLILFGSNINTLVLNYLELLCFNCDDMKPTSEIVRFPDCECQLCRICLRKKLDKATKKNLALNKYEKKFFEKTRCCCNELLKEEQAGLMLLGEEIEPYKKEAMKRLDVIVGTCCLKCLDKQRNEQEIGVKIKDAKFRVLAVKEAEDMTCSYADHVVCFSCIERVREQAMLESSKSTDILCRLCDVDHHVDSEVWKGVFKATSCECLIL